MSEQKYVCDNGSVGAYAPALPLRFFYFLLDPGACRGTYAARSNYQPAFRAREGRTLHAAFIPRCAYKLVVVMAHKNLLAVKEPRQCLRAHGYRTRGRRGTDLEADKTRRMFLSGKAQGCLSRLPLQSRPPQSTRG